MQIFAYIIFYFGRALILIIVVQLLSTFHLRYIFHQILQELFMSEAPLILIKVIFSIVKLLAPRIYYFTLYAVIVLTCLLIAHFSPLPVFFVLLQTLLL